jgi:hypothetical protein
MTPVTVGAGREAYLALILTEETSQGGPRAGAYLKGAFSPSRRPKMTTDEATLKPLAPHCPTLSQLLRMACSDRETTVWWVVVTDETSLVYPVSQEHTLLGRCRERS